MSILKKIRYRANYQYKLLKDHVDYKNIFTIQSTDNILQTNDKKIISFCLYGSSSLYMHGALKNIELVKNIYPDWILRFYIGSDIPINIKKEIIDSGVEVFTMLSSGVDNRYTLWRFLAADDNSVQAMLSRDTDSRFTIREKKIVDEWLSSPFDFHIIRDHEYHQVRIMAGMWGAKRHILHGLRLQLINFKQKQDVRGVDQNFLSNIIYPMVKSSSMIHDSRHFFADEKTEVFEPVKTGEPYIGEIIKA